MKYDTDCYFGPCCFSKTDYINGTELTSIICALLYIVCVCVGMWVFVVALWWYSRVIFITHIHKHTNALYLVVIFILCNLCSQNVVHYTGIFTFFSPFCCCWCCLVPSLHHFHHSQRTHTVRDKFPDANELGHWWMWMKK